MGRMVEAQPGAAWSVNARTNRTQRVTKMVSTNTIAPNAAIIRSGVALNEVMPSAARSSMRRSGYFVSPATRMPRS